MHRSNCPHCEIKAPISDHPLPATFIGNFLRHVRGDTDVIAVKIANDLLDSGQTVEQILTTDHELRISVAANCDGSYDVDVSCIVGSGCDVVGDGGCWQVYFGSDGKVIRALSESRTFYD